MKLSIILIFSVVASVAMAAQITPDEIAREMIRTVEYGAINPINNSEEAMIAASIVNSQLRLQHIMLSSETTEEVRVCFALLLIRNRLMRTSDEAERSKLLFYQKALGKHLIEVQIK
jgi:hypothetical protein